jgi:transcriptional regulator GlxA family with amidase domain
MSNEKPSNVTPLFLSRRAMLSYMSSLTVSLPALSSLPLATMAGSARDAQAANDPTQTPSAQAPGQRKLVLGMVVFEGFQLLDTYGPLEMFGGLLSRVDIRILAEKPGTVRSSAGPATAVDHTIAQAPPLDILMIPGGMGTRREVDNAAFVEAFKALAQATPHVASICTGAAVLARTGLLDGIPATTNKRAWQWATSQGPKVQWVAQARWVEHGKYFTSSGISAGTDMALALIAKLFGKEQALKIAQNAEYEWNDDSHHDPFAKINGLVG